MPKRARTAARAPRRSAFTLIEMLVALGVLIIALAIATTVFGITSKVTRQTAAANELSTQIDALMRQIEEDLSAVDPTRSILAIYGRTQAAALNDEQRNASRYYRVLVGDPNAALSTGSGGNYSNPRADILMFLTQRQQASSCPPLIDPNNATYRDTFQAELVRGARLGPLRVMYGHATLAAAAGTPGNWSLARFRHIEDVLGSTNPDPLRMSQVPLSKWQLVRQAAIIEPIPYSNNGDLGFSQQTMTRLWKCDATDPRGIENKGGYNGPRAGDCAPLALTEYLRAFAPYYNSLNRQVGIALARPYEFPRWDASPTAMTGVSAINANIRWNDLSSSFPGLYNGPTYFNLVRSLMFANADLDGDGKLEWQNHCFAVAVEDPPVGLSSNLGQQRLGGCLWFQVEFLLPEDARNSPESAAVLPANFPSGVTGDPTQTYQRDDVDRWVEVPQDRTYVFVPDTAENRQLVAGALDAAGIGQLSLPVRTPDFSFTINEKGNQRAIFRTWPYAIRITVRAIDPRTQLEQPLVRTLVHRFP